MSEETLSVQESLAELREEVRALRARGHAESYIAICNLQASYGYYVDRAVGLASDLSRRGTREIAGSGSSRAERVRQYLHSRPRSTGTSFNLCTPAVFISSRKANGEGRWRAHPDRVALRLSALGVESVYENIYGLSWRWRIAGSIPSSLLLQFDRGPTTAGPRGRTIDGLRRPAGEHDTSLPRFFVRHPMPIP